MKEKRISPPCVTDLVEPFEDATSDSVRLAMDHAWTDHHHARNQTWKALQMEAVLAAGLIGVDVQLKDAAVTIAAGILVVLSGMFGIFITLRHRDVEVRKITHIFNCENFLGLHRPDLICDISIPGKVTILDVFRFWKMNTSLFILRMHVAIIAFACLFIFVRWFK